MLQYLALHKVTVQNHFYCHVILHVQGTLVISIHSDSGAFTCLVYINDYSVESD